MKSIVLPLLLLACLGSLAWAQQEKKEPKSKQVVIVIHGGAGTILKEHLSAEKEAAIRAKLSESLDAGYAILSTGGSSINAVEAAIRVLEDSPLFNAGKGAVYTHEGRQEMDASIMDGSNLAAGSVAGVSVVKNPVSLALAVMAKSEHVMLTGKGAEEFAKQQGIEIVTPEYFYDERRLKQLQQAKEEEKVKLDHDGGYLFPDEFVDDDKKFGTVGAVALDENGNLAAATSTGGMTNKRYGRVGDSPIIGAGTYANNSQCAVSCTGHGEFFMRAVVAYDVFALMEYKGLSLAEATNEVVQNKLVEMGGSGGLIALDKDGNFSMEFNSAGMYRGVLGTKQAKLISIFKED